jgi:tRNA1(Val) A37 N6-methylase TrmN6
MPFENLIEAAALLLSENGIFSVIIPYKEERFFLALPMNMNCIPKITQLKERQLQKPNVYWLLAELKLVLSPQMN